MKILIYYEQYSYGGVDTHLSNLINYWPNNKDFFIILSNKENLGFNNLKSMIYNQNVKFKTLKNSLFVNKKILKYIYYFFSHNYLILKIIRQIYKLKPNIIISNNGGYPGGISNLYFTIIANLFNIKTFLLIHHAPVSQINNLKRYYYNFLVSLINKTKTKVITVSNATKENLEKYSNLKKIKVIHNGLSISLPEINTFDFYKKYKISKDKILIGLVSPIEPHKGHKNFLKTFSLSEKISLKSHLLIIGKGNEKIIKEIYNKVYELKLNKVVTICDFIPGPSIDFVSKLDILVMPTLDFESFGYSMAEAMISNVPVIASNVGGVSEIIEDKVDGFLINPYDAKLWIETLENLINDKNLREKIGIKGKKKIEEKFNAKIMSIKYYNFINKS